MAAKFVDIDEEVRKLEEACEEDELLERDQNIEKQAKNDLFDTQRSLCKGSKRRASPRWSAPVELLVMAMSPGWP